MNCHNRFSFESRSSGFKVITKIIAHKRVFVSDFASIFLVKKITLFQIIDNIYFTVI